MPRFYEERSWNLLGCPESSGTPRPLFFKFISLQHKHISANKIFTITIYHLLSSIRKLANPIRSELWRLPREETLDLHLDVALLLELFPL